MKIAPLFFIFSAIFIAPHLTEKAAQAASIVCLFAAAIFAVLEPK